MITVNLTTTYHRLGLCRIALISLLTQSKTPDRINVWVSTEPYLRDKGIKDVELIKELLESLPCSETNRINFRWIPNIGPYRKLIPILREAEAKDVIVTADDDIFYSKDWLKRLLEDYDKSGGDAVAVRVRKKRINFLGKVTSYLYWKLISRYTVVDDDGFVVTFGGGAVLNKSMFREQDITDDNFLNLAPTADDLWYSKLLQLNGIRVVVVPDLLEELNFVEHADGLTNHNFPKVTSLFQKLRFQVWDRLMGFLGIPVCGNDIVYNKINNYFNSKKLENEIDKL